MSDYLLDVLTQTAQEKLKQMVLAIEKLEEEKADTASEIKDRYAEARSLGFDTKALKLTIKRRKRSREELETEESMVELYEGTLEGAQS
jgi:uncharacterized protein (UPF0335 family)